MKPRAASKWKLPAAFFALWAASLALPAIDTGAGADFNGFDVLLRGWRAADEGLYAWYANPLFLAALGAAWARRFGISALAAGAGSLLALTSFLAEAAARDRGLEGVQVSFGPGFYLWLVAQIGLCVSSCLAFRTMNSRSRANWD